MTDRWWGDEFRWTRGTAAGKWGDEPRGLGHLVTSSMLCGYCHNVWSSYNIDEVGLGEDVKWLQTNILTLEDYFVQVQIIGVGLIYIYIFSFWVDTQIPTLVKIEKLHIHLNNLLLIQFSRFWCLCGELERFFETLLVLRILKTYDFFPTNLKFFSDFE